MELRYKYGLVSDLPPPNPRRSRRENLKTAMTGPPSLQSRLYLLDKRGAIAVRYLRPKYLARPGTIDQIVVINDDILWNSSNRPTHLLRRGRLVHPTACST